jgi:hypothetical protein
MKLYFSGPDKDGKYESPELLKGNIFKSLTRIKPNYSIPEEHSVILYDYSFVNTRDPFERLYSGYNDKMRNDKTHIREFTDPYKIVIGNSVIFVKYFKFIWIL